MANLDLNSWLTGFALGLCGKPLPFAKKTPTAYSYNGVVLPKLPEWDREAYPYAVIFNSIDGAMFSYPKFICSTLPWVYEADINYSSSDGGTVIESTLRDGTWSEFVIPSYISGQIIRCPTWTTHDIFYGEFDNDAGKRVSTGELFMAKSPNPIPVYE